MKKIVLIICLFISYFGFSQGGPKLNVAKFVGELTSTQRDALDVPTGERWLIWNATTTQFEHAGSNDVWSALGTSGLSSTDIDTFAELDALVADQSLMNFSNAADASILDTSTFSGNLDSFDDTLQELADAFDDITAGVNVINKTATQQFIDIEANTGNFWDLVFYTTSDQDSRGYIRSFGTGLSLYAEDGSTARTYVDIKKNYTRINATDYTLTETFQFDMTYDDDNDVARRGNVNDAVSIDASGFSGNLTSTDDTIQELADAVDGLSLSGTSLPVDDTTSLVQDPVDNTKQVRIDAGDITTGTTRTITMPDADVDLGDMVATANIDQDINGKKTFTEAIAITKENSAQASIEFYDDDGTTDRALLGYDIFLNEFSIANTTSNNEIRFPDSGGINTDADFTANSFIKSGATSDDVLLGDGTTTSLAAIGGGTDDQTASEVPIIDAAGYYTGTDVEAMGQETGASLAGKVENTISGRNGTALNAIQLETAAQITSNGAPSSGEAVICTDCSDYIEVALSDYTTDLTTGTSKAYWRAPFAMTVTDVRASVLTAPTGSTIIVDINENGTTIMSTNKLSIDASEKTSTTAATAAGVTDTSIADDAEITFDIDQVGSTIAGAGLLVKIYYTRF